MIPLDLWDVGLWLAAMAVILLVTSEVLGSTPGIAAYFRIEKKRLRIASLGCGLAFLVTVVIRAFQSP
jgi:hypothetical protein